MTRWDIDPAGVAFTLSLTKDGAEKMKDAVEALVKDVLSAAGSAGTVVEGTTYTPAPAVGPVADGTSRTGPMGPIGQALGQYLQSRQAPMRFMATRTANAINGAASATNAYAQGQLQQAADCQASAVAAAKVQDAQSRIGKQVQDQTRGDFGG
ncbi:DUF6507 family protein [Streptomyces coffeae]|uniref:Uncharacterized protein n=1 Tax=Streptomyces coffeae TaxID=621382 RepID=A0ABS1NP68_9ACTN|nr:DUF6507 family protein [Streptomyces coffeae]MBL1101900.1 hypothetical protein [Streptomyces coffeae]